MNIRYPINLLAIRKLWIGIGINVFVFTEQENLSISILLKIEKEFYSLQTFLGGVMSDDKTLQFLILIG